MCLDFLCRWQVRFCEEQRQASSRSALPVCQKKRQSGPHLWGREGSTQICTAVCDGCDSFTACRLCRLEPAISHNHHHRLLIFHSSVHCFPASLNILRSSKERGCACWEHCNICAVVSSAFPQAHVVSPV